MSPNWLQIKRILAEAVTRVSAVERVTYLAEACGGDAELRAEVEKLLRAYDHAGAFLEQPALLVPDLAPDALPCPSEQVGDSIGPYRLLESIGEGGCGVVYLAEQERPIRRRVALKVIKLGMDTKAFVARFEAERQALALMDHPHIARVLDAGATATGRPYFVMELVQGTRITDFCDENRLSTEARLRLFVQVCQALQHAHQKGIIHRDLKPSNILVSRQDGEPACKVIDFGIAKAVDQPLTDQTLVTLTGQFVGTPAYMSPEQADRGASDMDTRSDIYALGVLLYELLTGHTPFDRKDLTSAGLDHLRRVIREREPPRPSTRLHTLAAADLATVARTRGAEPPQLVRRVHGDLDWIVMRCLEKNRTRRYETANSLADDILRHLRHEPILARPPSRWYRFQRLARRNRAVFAAAGLVLVALLVGLTFSVWTLGKERTARRVALAAEGKAQAEAGKSREVAVFLKDMLRGFGPSAALGRDTTILREVLDKTTERVGKDLKGQPEVEAEVRTTLGEVYQALGRYDQAEGQFRQALRLQRTLGVEMSAPVADAMDRLGDELVSCRHETVESADLIGRALTIRTNLLGAEHVQVATSLHHLASVQSVRGRLLEADELLNRALAMRRRLLGNAHVAVAESLTALAGTRSWQARQDEAEAYAREALAILARAAPDEGALLTLASAQSILGEILRKQGRLTESLALLQEAAQTRRSLLGLGHPDYASTLYRLGCALQSADRLKEAETAVREALAINRATVGGSHSSTRTYLERLGQILRLTGRFAEAEAAYAEARPSGLCPGLILVLRAQGKLAAAEARMAQVEAEARQGMEAAAAGLPSEAAALTRLQLALVLWYRGRIAESESALAEAWEMADRLPPSATLIDEFSLQAMRNAALEVWFDREAEHLALCRRVLPWAEAQPNFTPKGRAAAMVNLRPVTDVPLQTLAFNLARQAAASAPTNALLVWYRLNLGVAAYRLGNFAEAERWLLQSEQDGPSAWHPAARTGTAKFFRALIRCRQGHLEAARQLFAEAESTLPPLPEAVQWALAEGSDYDDLMYWLAYREARQLLGPSN